MAGFSVASQTFAVCDTVSSGLLTSPVSGLLGLAYQSIASSGALPFWQALVSSGAWDSPIMAFQLTRYVSHGYSTGEDYLTSVNDISYLNDTNAQGLEPGGSFTMGMSASHCSIK